MSAPSWYLDRLVAEQKRRVHQDWIRTATANRPTRTVLKTDLFEEAFGADRIFDDLFPDADLAIGMDLSYPAVIGAARRYAPAFHSIAADARRLPFASGCMDVIVSPSTLDHFHASSDLDHSLDELARVLRPGGMLLISLDNPRNPSYHLLRWLSRRGWTPFTLGHTVSLAALERMLIARGFRIQSTGHLIHNPRGVSTALFLVLRKILGKLATVPIRGLLAAFASLGKLPSRSFTACFLTVAATKETVSKEPGSEQTLARKIATAHRT